MAKAKTPKELTSHIRFLKSQIVTAEKALKKSRAKKAMKKKPMKKKVAKKRTTSRKKR